MNKMHLKKASAAHAAKTGGILSSMAKIVIQNTTIEVNIFNSKKYVTDTDLYKVLDLRPGATFAYLEGYAKIK
jgi:hypothetical protein